MKKIIKRIGILLIIAFVGIQFIPTKRNVSNEVYKADFMKVYKVPSEISEKLKVSCYDCHSNNTEYPWYSRIQPATWYLEGHVNEGKEELNFNEFGNYSARKQRSKLSSMIRELKSDMMPLSSYLIIHKDAIFDKNEKKKMVTFFENLKLQIEAEDDRDN